MRIKKVKSRLCRVAIGNCQQWMIDSIGFIVDFHNPVKSVLIRCFLPLFYTVQDF